MDTVWSVRLEVIKHQVEDVIGQCELAIQEVQKDSAHDLGYLARLLKSKNERYVVETHIFMEKAGNNLINDQLIEHTKLQMKADQIVAQLDHYVKDTGSTRTSGEQATSRLPKIELLKYKGEILRWSEFWDRFTTNVHNKPLRNVDKLAYLQTCLEGAAKEAIEGLETTDVNYDIAISTLMARFGKRAIVIDAHYRELYALKKQDNSVRESRRLLNEIERHLRILQSFNENTEGAHLRSVIIEKFPNDLIRELRVRMVSDDETVSGIRKHLEHLIMARESTGHISKDNQDPSKLVFATETLQISEGRQPGRVHQRNEQGQFKRNTKFNQQAKRNPLFHTRPLKRKSDFKRDNHNKKRLRMSCIFCEGQHFNDECRTAPTIEERKRRLGQRCFICFKGHHRARDCKCNIKCKHCGQKQHNRALCPQRTTPTSTFATRTFQANCEEKGATTVLQTTIINIEKENKSHIGRALLDTGSQRSYVTSKVAKELKLTIKEKNKLLVYTFGSDKPKEMDNLVAEFVIKTRKGISHTIEASVVPYITNKIDCPTSFINMDMSKYLMADDGSAGEAIDMLIGNDYYYKFVNGDIRQIEDELFLVDSDFGLIISGKIRKPGHDLAQMSLVTYVNSCEVEQNHFTKPDLPLYENNVRLLWDLEAIGITDSPNATQDEGIVKHFNETTKFKDQRYLVKWPWITYPPDLPDNYGLAFGRLKGLLKRLNNEQLTEYDNIFKQQLESGIIELIQESEEDSRNPVHYLSHHGVWHEGKRLRVVCDASAKLKERNSLNECLYKGPLMLEDLTALLINFRKNKIGIVADIEKAFLQVGLQNEDKDVTRLLWLKDITKGLTHENLIHLRFTRVPFGIVSSPFLLTATIHYHLNRVDQGEGLVKKIGNKCYVDNLVTGTNSKEEAIQLYKDTRRVFDEISMNIRDWNSNNKEFLKEIPKEQRGKETERTNVLGMVWDLSNDTLNLKPLTHKKKEEGTKREVLRTIASIFDPCGFVSPIIMPLKIFLQELWKSKIKWDTPLSEELCKKWEDILKNLDRIKTCNIARCITSRISKDTKYQLHCFADASKYSYATVVYLMEICRGEKSLSFVMSKSRLTPLKDQENLQIPRLELLGYLIGSKLLAYVNKSLEIEIEKQFLWTDSQVVLSWMKSEKLLPPFIARRINQIKEHKNVQHCYVVSENNPADIATRADVNRLDMWLKGPQFLLRNEQDWFKINKTFISVAPEVGESLNNRVDVEQMDLEIEEEQPTLPREENNITKENQVDTSEWRKECTESHTLEKEERNTIHKIQKEYFCRELEGQRTDLSRSLDLFIDNEGILRSRGRLSRTTWSYDKKYPILIPRNCEFTIKVIKNIHEKNYHVGVSHTLSLVREKYWIPKGRSQVQRTLKECQSCVRHGGGPFKLPPMPPLPSERVTYARAYSYVGLDYLGPMNVLKDDNTTKKVWICLFTCLAVRAIQLELVKDLTAAEFLLALRRFVATRGLPAFITSDNATHFKLSAEVLTGEFCIENKITWKFIPELAPWHGGCYERLVGLVKHCLKRTLDKHTLNESQLTTVIKECETILNTRPLTYVGTELEHVLKPMDFLTPGECVMIRTSFQEFLERGSITKNDLIESWKRGQMILQEFVTMFTNQYLTSLRERWSKHKEPRITSNRVPKIGQIVQIKGDTTNRLCWKVGRIVSLIKGKDEEVRVAKIKVDNKEFTRAISHLYPLEIEEETETDVEEERTDDENREGTQENIRKERESRKKMTATKDEKKPINEGSSRPRRDAARRARERIETWTKQLFNSTVTLN